VEGINPVFRWREDFFNRRESEQKENEVRAEGRQVKRKWSSVAALRVSGGPGESVMDHPGLDCL
jgi:hypothetical protein